MRQRTVLFLSLGFFLMVVGHVSAASWTLIGWNDLGMHCMDGRDYSVFSILPPYNTVHAQLIRNGDLVTDDTGITVTYEAVADPSGSINTTSADKVNFWDYVGALFGASPVPDMGLAGDGMPGVANTPQVMHFESAHSWFNGEGIPITPYDDTGIKNYYPMVRLTARNSSGSVLATTDVVLPVSDEMDCSACHQSGSGTAARPGAGWEWACDAERDYKLNILRLHDEQKAGHPLYTAALAAAGYDPGGLMASVSSGQPVLCAHCHGSNALPGTGVSGVPPLTQVIHDAHAGVIDPVNGMTLESSANRTSCYRCHPGSETLCLRGAMGKAVASDGSLSMQCQDCHGTMSAVGAVGRAGWFEQPGCGACHTGTAMSNNGQIRYLSVFDAPEHVRDPVNTTFATNPDTPATGFSLYRFSTGHGDLQCSACHGSPHAIYPASHPNDNIQSEQLQGHAGTVSDCATCHNPIPYTKTGGPHGMHPIGQFWVKSEDTTDHTGAAKEGGERACRACHGADYRGTVLSRALGDRVWDADDYGTKRFWKGQQIGCYECHNGPQAEGANGNTRALVSNTSASTTANQAVVLSLPADPRDGDSLELRIVSQPDHGTVGLTGSTATYAPYRNFIGADRFTFAAWDGKNDSNLATGTVSVVAGIPELTVWTAAPPTAMVEVGVPFWADADIDNVQAEVSYTWTFEPGAGSVDTAHACRTFTTPGTYTWTLVTQAAGVGSTNSGEIVITEAFNDSDGDGMDDDWERANFDGDLDTADEETDSDHDGFIDLHEFLAGTLPGDPASYLRIHELAGSESGAGGSLVIRWPSVSGKSYALDFAPGPPPAPSNPVASGIPAAPPMNVWTTAPPADVHGWYRVRLETP